MHFPLGGPAQLLAGRGHPGQDAVVHGLKHARARLGGKIAARPRMPPTHRILRDLRPGTPIEDGTAAGLLEHEEIPSGDDVGCVSIGRLKRGIVSKQSAVFAAHPGQISVVQMEQTLMDDG